MPFPQLLILWAVLAVSAAVGLLRQGHNLNALLLGLVLLTAAGITWLAALSHQAKGLHRSLFSWLAKCLASGLLIAALAKASWQQSALFGLVFASIATLLDLKPRFSR